ncbi:hypothetical protein BH10BAC5_BH10BAC5_12630 [soil metagenome]
MNRISHFELPSNDPGKLKEFYSKVFGWNYQQWGNEEYFLTQTGDKSEPGIEGAIMKKKHPDQPVVVSMNVENLDKSIEDVNANGGEIVVPKMAIPTMGYLAYFKDPDGNILGMMQVDADAK